MNDVYKLLKNGYDIYENGVHVKDKYNAVYWGICNDGKVTIRVEDGTEYGTVYDLIESDGDVITIVPRNIEDGSDNNESK